MIPKAKNTPFTMAYQAARSFRDKLLNNEFTYGRMNGANVGNDMPRVVSR